jgi:hypothetical protein
VFAAREVTESLGGTDMSMSDIKGKSMTVGKRVSVEVAVAEVTITLIESGIGLEKEIVVSTDTEREAQREIGIAIGIEIMIAGEEGLTNLEIGDQVEAEA